MSDSIAKAIRLQINMSAIAEQPHSNPTLVVAPAREIKPIIKIT